MGRRHDGLLVPKCANAHRRDFDFKRLDRLAFVVIDHQQREPAVSALRQMQPCVPKFRGGATQPAPYAFSGVRNQGGECVQRATSLKTVSKRS
jgi:hypothetical protein